MRQEKHLPEEYLSDEELEKLIGEVETEGMYHAPDYLAQIILNKAERQAVKESVEIIPIRNTIRETIREGKPAVVTPTSKKLQLVTYSAKIIFAAAAAIALVIMVPSVENSLQKNAYQTQLELQNEDAKDIETKEKTNVMRRINEKSNDICSKLFEKTNELFHREEK